MLNGLSGRKDIISDLESCGVRCGEQYVIEMASLGIPDQCSLRCVAEDRLKALPVPVQQGAARLFDFHWSLAEKIGFYPIQHIVPIRRAKVGVELSPAFLCKPAAPQQEALDGQ